MSESTPAPHGSAHVPQDPPATEAMSPAATNRLEALRTLRPAQVILTVGVAAVVTTVLVLSIGRLAGFTKLGDRLSGATWGWLGLCALGQIGVFIGYAGAFRTSVAGSGDLFGEPADTDSNDIDSDDIDLDDIDLDDTDGKPGGDTCNCTASNPSASTGADGHPGSLRQPARSAGRSLVLAEGCSGRIRSHPTRGRGRGGGHGVHLLGDTPAGVLQEERHGATHHAQHRRVLRVRRDRAGWARWWDWWIPRCPRPWR